MFPTKQTWKTSYKPHLCSEERTLAPTKVIRGQQCRTPSSHADPTLCQVFIEGSFTSVQVREAGQGAGTVEVETRTFTCTHVCTVHTHTYMYNIMICIICTVCTLHTYNIV